MVIKDIRRGLIEPGVFLSQRGLCDAYGCGRWIAAKTLEALAASIWLEPASHGRYVVAEPTIGSLQQAIELRALIEVYAVEKLVPMLTDQFIQRLWSINRQMWKAGSSVDFAAAIRHNRVFHTCVVESVDEGPLSRQLQQLYQIQGFEDSANFETVEQVFKSACEHAVIIDALDIGNLLRLRNAVRNHVIDNAEGLFGGT